MSMPSIVRGVFARPSTLLQAREPLLRVDGEHLGLHVACPRRRAGRASAARRSRRGGGRPSRSCSAVARRLHLRLHLGGAACPSCLRAPGCSLLDLPAVLLAASRGSCTGRCTGGCCAAGTAGTSASGRRSLDVQRAGAELEDPLQHLHRRPAGCSALVNGPYSCTPLRRGLRVNSTRGNSSRMRICRYGNVLSSFRSLLNCGWMSLISRASVQQGVDLAVGRR